MDKKLAEKRAEIKEQITDTGESFIELLAGLVAEQIYEDGFFSPYTQLLLVEQKTEIWEVSYSSLSRALRKEAKKWKKCIACKKQLAKPCFTINVKDISYLRKRKHQTGTGKGDQHLNKHSPKMKQIEAIINSLGEYKLDNEMQRNIKDNLKDLRPELLTLMTGKLTEKRRGSPLWATLAAGLLPLLPDREKNFFTSGDIKEKIPKYGSKIDIKDYLTFWNYAARLRYFDLMEAKGEMKLVGDIRTHITYKLGLEPPFPCEKHTKVWERFSTE